MAPVFDYLATGLCYELRQRRDARQTFDWADVAALIAGAVVAPLVDWYAVRRSAARTGADAAAARVTP